MMHSRNSLSCGDGGGGRLWWLVLLVFSLTYPGSGADITFFGYSDCHYGAVRRGEPAVTRRPHVQWINELPGTPWPKEIGGVVDVPKGVIMAGDLIDHGAVRTKHPKQWADYISEFGVNGEGRVKFPVFEGLGNHDWNPDRVIFEHLKKRNETRLQLGFIDHVSENGYHYSWNWDGIHFINLNIFPGNEWFGEADTYSPGAHHPELARDFLKEDLARNIGKTGRPVIIVFHFRPIDENWWTYSAIDKFHRIVQDYNVILLMVGHQGGDVNNVWRGIHWASSNGVLEAFRITPDNVLVGASRRGSAWGRTLRKSIYLSYDSSELPVVVNNGDWASDITSSSATLSGKILYQGPNGGSQVTVYWGEEDGGDNPDKWQHSKPMGNQSPGKSFHVGVANLKPWNDYYYRCQARNAKGEAWAAASIPFTTGGVLPGGWSASFVGYEQRPDGGAHMTNGVMVVRGSGRNIGERGQRIDNCQYAYTNARGSVEIRARLKGMNGKTRDPKAGIMFRENLEMGSKSVSVLYSKRAGVQLFVRSDVEGATEVSSADPNTSPGWLRLVRRDEVFTGYSSSDGKEWKQVGSAVSVNMVPDIKAGFAVTAGNRDSSRSQTALFERVTIGGMELHAAEEEGKQAQ